MIALFFSTIAFVGGIYVGTRWSEKIKAIYYSIISQ